MAEYAVPPLESIDPAPVLCLHADEPRRIRPHTVVSGGRVWNICDECRQRLEAEWQRAHERQAARAHDLNELRHAEA